MRRISGLLTALLLLGAVAAHAQQPAPAAAPAASALFVFLDCQDVGCDYDYFRTEMNSVNWVRDRQVSDVHILVTGQDTGAGGREFTITFIGLRGFAGVTDTLRTSLPANFTDDERRVRLAKMFRAGLVRYVARTPASAGMIITLGDGSEKTAQATAKTDPWNAWVFNVNAYTNAYAEQTYSQYNLQGRLSADRVTEKWKTRFSINQSYSDSKTKYQVDSTIGGVPVRRPDNSVIQKDTAVFNPRRNYRGSFSQVMSLSPRWSAGFRADVNSSTYENTTRQVRATPALEFDVYPYSEATRRQIRVEYGVGVTTNAYRDTTIYDRIKETLPLHRLVLSVAQRQPWGSVDVGITGTHYLRRINQEVKYHISSYAQFDVRLFKGFGLNFYGNYDVIHDQFSLAKKNYSVQQILLRQFQRGSTYSYFFGGGIHYTFGSIFNNVVNPRFE
jgi:hypothetical protein